MSDLLKLKDPHLFAHESIQIRTLQNNAIISGFAKTLSLYKAKLREPMKDPFHDHDTFLPNYSTSGDKEPSVSDGYMKRPEAEIKTLQADFLRFNVRFWMAFLNTILYFSIIVVMVGRGQTIQRESQCVLCLLLIVFGSTIMIWRLLTQLIT